MSTTSDKTQQKLSRIQHKQNQIQTAKPYNTQQNITTMQVKGISITKPDNTAKHNNYGSV